MAPMPPARATTDRCVSASPPVLCRPGPRSLERAVWDDQTADLPGLLLRLTPARYLPVNYSTLCILLLVCCLLIALVASRHGR